MDTLTAKNPSKVPNTSTTPVALMDVGTITAATSTSGCYIGSYAWYDANGNVLLQEYYPTQTTPHTFHANLSNSDFEDAAAGLANGTNTVHILVRLSTGELKEAFTTTLKVG